MTELLPEPDDDARVPTDRIIVAIPTATEPIHHMGDVSEPKHLTLVRLGSPEENPDLDTDAITEALRSVAENSEGPLTAPVEKQGPLGDDGAQVAFVGGEEIPALHDSLLADPAIKTGHDAIEQFPEFTPHLTLGYEPSVAVEDDLPQEVIFDRLGLWDGDEHTEFPLGPSASTEENTDGPETEEPELVTVPNELVAKISLSQIDAAKMGLNDEFTDELLVAFSRHVDDPLVVNDAATLATACAQADALADEPTRLMTQRVLMRRARALGCQHVIPTDWLRKHTTAAAAAVVPAATDAPPQHSPAAPDLFKLKSQLSTLSDTVLQAAYIRGVREFTMTATSSRPPLSREVVAQARVNSLIRLAQGDLSARTDDQDLLS